MSTEKRRRSCSGWDRKPNGREEEDGEEEGREEEEGGEEEEDEDDFDFNISSGFSCFDYGDSLSLY